MLGSVDGRVSYIEPEESEDDILLTAAYDIEEMFLGNPFDIHIEGASVAYCTSLVYGLVHVANHNGGGELLSGEAVFSDELSINARDICARIY